MADTKTYRSKFFGKGPVGGSTHKQALDYDAKVKALKALGKPFVHVDLPGNVYLADVASDFFQDLEAHGKLKQYHEDWIKTLEVKVLPLVGDIPLDRFTAHDVRKVAQVFQEAGNSPATINRYMGYLKQIGNHGVRVEMIAKNPFRFWRKLPEPKRVVMLTPEDLAKIYEASPEHVRWTITVALNLVARVGEAELFSLKWSDVDWERQEIVVKMPKVAKTKRLILSDAFMSILREKRAEAQTDYLVEYRGRPVRSIKTAWQNAVRKVGLDYMPRPYDLRHVAISHLLNQGVPLPVVMKMAGHASPNMTYGTYYHTDPAALRNAAETIQRIQ